MRYLACQAQEAIIGMIRSDSQQPQPSASGSSIALPLNTILRVSLEGKEQGQYICCLNRLACHITIGLLAEGIKTTVIWTWNEIMNWWLQPIVSTLGTIKKIGWLDLPEQPHFIPSKWIHLVSGPPALHRHHLWVKSAGASLALTSTNTQWEAGKSNTLGRRLAASIAAWNEDCYWLQRIARCNAGNPLWQHI
jgi:hypothetical protein